MDVSQTLESVAQTEFDPRTGKPMERRSEETMSQFAGWPIFFSSPRIPISDQFTIRRPKIIRSRSMPSSSATLGKAPQR